VIRNFKDEETTKIANGERSRKRPVEIQAKAYRLLRIMARIDDWNDLPIRRETSFTRSLEIAPGNMPYGSTSNGASRLPRSTE
jgi:plasmid maintenance system killer protein